jgi:hypothetical protein
LMKKMRDKRKTKRKSEKQCEGGGERKKGQEMP